MSGGLSLEPTADTARLFTLSWMGGATERSFRRRTSGVDELPWGTLRAADYPPVLVDRARYAWTDGAFVEHATAIQLAGIAERLLRVNAPVDLIGMAGAFVADEMVHVELHARVLAELGGAAPLQVDDRFHDTPTLGPPLLDLAARIVRTCCIGESLAVPVLAATRAVATHPLVRGVLSRIVADEAPHAQLGWTFLDWAPLDAAARTQLGAIATAELAGIAHTWTSPTSRARDGLTREGFTLADVHDLGWLDTERYVATATAAVAGIVSHLARYGITAVAPLAPADGWSPPGEPPPSLTA